MRAVLRLYGAKWSLAKWIVAHFPHHDIYVEPFCGSAAVLLSKPPVSVEVLNDLDEEIINFFRVLRERPEEFIRAIFLTPYARSEAEKAKSADADDDLERARLFLVRSWMTIGGPTTRWATGFRYRTDGRMAALLRWWQNMPERLAYVVDRLRSVLIENRDYKEILQSFDGPNTLFYLDPPYPPTTRSRQWRTGGYRYDFSEADHEEFLQRILSLQGMVVLSAYPHPLYEKMLASAGWTFYSRRVINGNGKPAEEMLWLNPAAVQRQRQIQLSLEAQE